MLFSLFGRKKKELLKQGYTEKGAFPFNAYKTKDAPLTERRATHPSFNQSRLGLRVAAAKNPHDSAESDERRTDCGDARNGGRVRACVGQVRPYGKGNEPQGWAVAPEAKFIDAVDGADIIAVG
jgi:hypothetical protein